LIDAIDIDRWEYAGTKNRWTRSSVFFCAKVTRVAEEFGVCGGEVVVGGFGA
jgi:hypothetical protein